MIPIDPSHRCNIVKNVYFNFSTGTFLDLYSFYLLYVLHDYTFEHFYCTLNVKCFIRTYKYKKIKLKNITSSKFLIANIKNLFLIF